jgi:transcription elongation factor Elf1
MSTPQTEAWYDCPHCGYAYMLTGTDSIYIDHVSDGCAMQCEDCGEWYQLQCESVDIHMDATKAPADVIFKLATREQRKHVEE